MEIREIVERPTNQRYWVVRASGGDFVKHFRQEGIVAIGHIDDLNISESGSEPFFPELDPLKKSIESLESAINDGSSKHRAYARFNQVKTFIADISVGDLVVTADHKRLSIGRVIGHPFIAHTPIRYFYDKERKKFSEMPFQLRRFVKWGPVMARETLPTAMKRSISARQTVFNIDSHWASIYHLLYPLFSYRDNIYLSAHIRQSDEINAFSVSQVFRVLTELEIIARSYETLLKNPQINFERLFNDFRQSEDFKLKTTAEFMSPGSVWSRLGLNDKQGKILLLVALLYGAVFGVDIKVLKIDGVLDKETRQIIIKYFLNRLDANDAVQMKHKLQLDIPNFNTKPLEDNSLDAKPDDRAIAIVERFDKRT